MSSSHKGFTLAEVLIALALLGVVAAFTIPKVLQATGNQERTAKVREAVATLEQAWYAQKLQNSYTAGGSLYNSLVINPGGLNVINQGLGTPVADGALQANHPCGNTAHSAGWVQFPNGTIISGLNRTGVNGRLLDIVVAGRENHLICIDFNGNAGRNTTGQDIFFGNFNQFGNFDGGTIFPGGEAVKNFNWGGSVPVYAAGAPGSTPASVRTSVQTATAISLAPGNSGQVSSILVAN